MAHPATGPISPEQLRALADAPFGKAGEVLRQHDPLWGYTNGDTPMKEWKVTVQKAIPMSATVFVEAPTEENARLQVNAMNDWDFDWDNDYADDFEIWNVEEAP